MGYTTYYADVGDTIPHLFDTFDGGTGASITMTGLAVTDIEIFKDGGTTARASDAGYALLGTDGIDEFGVGVHGFSIDTSDNTDAGFFVAGPWYHVVVDAITVDGQTVRFVACAFKLSNPVTVSNGGVRVQDFTTNAKGEINAEADTAIADAALATAAAATAIETDTQNIQSRLPTTLQDGRMDSHLGNIPAGAITATEAPNLDAAVSTRATPAEVQTELGTYDAPTKAELDTAETNLTALHNRGTVAGTVEASPAPTTTSIDVNVGAGTDRATGFWTGALVQITDGNGASQNRKVTTHTRVSATVARLAFSGSGTGLDRALATAPASGDSVLVFGVA